MPNHPLPVSTTKDPVTWLYPPIEPYNTGRLQVSPVHEIYFEESGNISGKPVIFLHGGPCGGSDPKQHRFFPPEKYRIVNFDPRRACSCRSRGTPIERATWIERQRGIAHVELVRHAITAALDDWQRPGEMR